MGIVHDLIREIIIEINYLIASNVNPAFSCSFINRYENQNLYKLTYILNNKAICKIETGTEQEVLQFLRGYLLALKEFNIGKN